MGPLLEPILRASDPAHTEHELCVVRSALAAYMRADLPERVLQDGCCYFDGGRARDSGQTRPGHCAHLVKRPIAQRLCIYVSIGSRPPGLGRALTSIGATMSLQLDAELSRAILSGNARLLVAA